MVLAVTVVLVELEARAKRMNKTQNEAKWCAPTRVPLEKPADCYE